MASASHFMGNLPVPKDECRRAIVARERESREQDITQVFIETPYRNDNCCSFLRGVFGQVALMRRQ